MIMKGGVKVMLQIESLVVAADGERILDGVSLSIPEGETHILMGPNGSGKTTLLHAIMGTGDIEILEGRIVFCGEDITALPPHDRARRGIGVAAQRPPAIAELTLRTVVDLVKEAAASDADIDQAVGEMNCDYLLDRRFNVNFSGGEAKRAEFLQLLVQRPKLALIDEPESGVDLDNIAVIGKALKKLLKDEKVLNRKQSGLIITHTGHILEFVNADKGYILLDGRIVCSGNPRDLFEEVRRHGYEGCVACARCQ